MIHTRKTVALALLMATQAFAQVASTDDTPIEIPSDFAYKRHYESCHWKVGGHCGTEVYGACSSYLLVGDNEKYGDEVIEVFDGITVSHYDEELTPNDKRRFERLSRAILRQYEVCQQIDVERLKIKGLSVITSKDAGAGPGHYED